MNSTWFGGRSKLSVSLKVGSFVGFSSKTIEVLFFFNTFPEGLTWMIWTKGSRKKKIIIIYLSSLSPSLTAPALAGQSLNPYFYQIFHCHYWLFNFDDLGISSIWTCRMLSIEYLLLFSVDRRSGIKSKQIFEFQYSTCQNQWHAEGITQ